MVLESTIEIEGSNECIKIFYIELLDYLKLLGDVWTAYNKPANYPWDKEKELLYILECLEEPITSFYNMIAWKNDGNIILIEVFIRTNKSQIIVCVMDDDIKLFQSWTGQ
uniref:Uncharacterized protein n=1 Tax=uncultured bacterium contig00004 TaxID=1181496 RepID=A0A806KAG4_9BACT|nr:hypothetical protein [uncultured bacterium contig00004]